MPNTYQWKGKNIKDRIVKGEMKAQTRDQIRSNLREKSMTFMGAKKRDNDFLMNFKWLQPKIKKMDIVLFTRQFSTMIDAGLSLRQSLDILQSQQQNRIFKKNLKTIKDAIESGSTFADALRRFPGLFNELFVNMIAAGEAGGILDVILARLSSYMEKMARLKRQVKGVLIYPSLTIVVSMIMVILIFLFVIPVFQEMFKNINGSLPLSSLFVISLSNFIITRFWYIVFFSIVIGFLIRGFCNHPKGRIIKDDLLLRLPIVGNLIRKVAISRFTRTTSTMISSGVSILDTLNIAAGISGNKIVESAISGAKESIAEGRSIAGSLSESRVFPPMVCSMIAVGESAGALDRMMEKIADFYDEEVDQAVRNLTGMIEPLMLIFLGIVLGGIVVTMYLPIFSMAGIVY